LSHQLGNAALPALQRHCSHSRSGNAARAAQLHQQRSNLQQFQLRQPCSLAALQPCSRAALQPCSRAALQPCSHAALQPCSRAALQPCSLAALQPCSLSALQPVSLAACQPCSTTLQPGSLRQQHCSLRALRFCSHNEKPHLRYQQQPYSPATNKKPQCPSIKEALQLQHNMCLYYMYKCIGITNIEMSCNVASGTARTACKADCKDAVPLALYYNMTCSCVSTGLHDD
jgi:hypothetical protein